MTQLFDQVLQAPNGASVRYDLFRPLGDEPRPLIACIHGGGWIMGDKIDLHEIGIYVASRGFAAACVSYRLAPRHPFPAAVDDVQNFVLAAKAHAKDLNITGKVGAFGISAGGHLVATLATSERVEGGFASRIAVGVDICGLTDITNPKQRHFPEAWSFINDFMGIKSYDEDPERYKQASPVYHADERTAPLLVAHGEKDNLVPFQDSVDLVRKLEEYKIPHEFIAYPNEGHSFEPPVWPSLLDRSTQFLKTYL